MSFLFVTKAEGFLSGVSGLAHEDRDKRTSLFTVRQRKKYNNIDSQGRSVENSRETLQAVVDYSKNNFFSTPDGRRPDFEVDTSVLAANVNDLISSGGLNLKNFAAALRVNKNYLVSLF